LIVSHFSFPLLLISLFGKSLAPSCFYFFILPPSNVGRHSPPWNPFGPVFIRRSLLPTFPSSLSVANHSFPDGQKNPSLLSFRFQDASLFPSPLHEFVHASPTLLFFPGELLKLIIGRSLPLPVWTAKVVFSFSFCDVHFQSVFFYL